MGEKILLPGGLRVEEPSPQDMLLQMLAFAVAGNPQTGEPGILQHLITISQELDVLIRMESHETPRAEIKRRIERNEAAMKLAQAEQIQAQNEQAEQATKVRRAMEAEIRAVPDEEEAFDIGGEG